MKKIILSILTILLFVNVFAQSGAQRRPASVGISFFMNDFQSAAEIKKSGLGSFLRSGDILRSDRLNAGLAVNFLKGLSNHVDFTASFGAAYVDYPVPNVAPFAKDNILVEATGGLNLKLLADNFWVVPFVDLGVGVSKYKGYYASFAPVGVGLQVNLLEEVFLNFNSQYRLPITENAANHLYHSFTLYTVLGKKKN
jgi:OmpA-OmpF porin, OOP family